MYKMIAGVMHFHKVISQKLHTSIDFFSTRFSSLDNFFRKYKLGSARNLRSLRKIGRKIVSPLFIHIYLKCRSIRCPRDQQGREPCQLMQRVVRNKILSPLRDGYGQTGNHQVTVASSLQPPSWT